MNNGSRKTTRHFGAILGVCAGLALGAVSSRAEAADAFGVTVNLISFSGTAPLLVQGTTGIIVQARLDAGAGCTAYNRNWDQIKSWLSIAQAAFLAGKRLNINYNACNGVNHIGTLVMVN